MCQHYWPETFRITDICEGLAENGHEVDVLCGIPNYPKGKFFEGYSYTKNRKQVHKGVNIRRAFEIPRGTNTNFRIFINFISFPLGEVGHFFRLLFSKKKYDKILIYQLSPVFMATMPLILGKVKKIPSFVYICDFWPHSLLSIIHIKNKLLIKWVTAFSYWHYKKADGLIGGFEGIATRLNTLVGIPKEKIVYIPQVCEKIYEERIYDEELHKRFEGTFNIVFAGAINPAQSFDTVVKAAQIVKESGITNICYIILGEGMSKGWLMEETARLGLNFVFEGLKPVEEVPKYQTLADAMLVALSKSDLFEYGIPVKVQSYMAAGKPIISAMNGAGKELINSVGCGISCDSGEHTALAEIIIKFYNMPKEEREKIGQKGRDYHFANFERNANLKKLMQFMDIYGDVN